MRIEEVKNTLKEMDENILKAIKIQEDYISKKLPLFISNGIISSEYKNMVNGVYQNKENPFHIIVLVNIDNGDKDFMQKTDMLYHEISKSIMLFRKYFYDDFKLNIYGENANIKIKKDFKLIM